MAFLRTLAERERYEQQMRQGSLKSCTQRKKQGVPSVKNKPAKQKKLRPPSGATELDAQQRARIAARLLSSAKMDQLVGVPGFTESWRYDKYAHSVAEKRFAENQLERPFWYHDPYGPARWMPTKPAGRREPAEVRKAHLESFLELSEDELLTADAGTLEALLQARSLPTHGSRDDLLRRLRVDMLGFELPKSYQ